MKYINFMVLGITIWLCTAVVAIILIGLCATARGAEDYPVSTNDTYRGSLSINPYAPDSTSNPYSRYGSPYSIDSINDPYGEYGSPYSQESPGNPYGPGLDILDIND